MIVFDQSRVSKQIAIMLANMAVISGHIWSLTIASGYSART
jgi:hypothetical protein